MKKSLFLIFLIGSYVGFKPDKLFGQSITSGPSSDATASVNMNNTPVTLYSGIPGISVPLHNISAYGMNVPIELRYNASGIKVEQLSSKVGLGWSLNAGGLITREVRGYPDEMLAPPGRSNRYKPVGYLRQGEYTDELWDSEIQPANALIATYDPKIHIDTKSGARLVQGYQFTGYNSTLPVHGYVDDVEHGYTLKRDTEADIYHFSFGRFSGKFTFNGQGVPKLLNDNKDLKIEYKLAPGYAAPAIPNGMSHVQSRNLGLLEWFTITTPDGTKYTFDKHEIQMAFNPTGTIKKPSPESPDVRCLGDSAYKSSNLTSHFVSGWYLTKIEKAKEKIEIVYDKEIETNHRTSQQLFANHSELRHTYTVTQVPVIRYIDWKDGRVSFGKGSVRPDMFFPSEIPSSRGARTLSDIQVEDKGGQLHRRINFQYGAFQKTPFSSVSSCANVQGMLTAHRERIKLVSVQVTEKQGSGAQKVLPPYKFEYDNTPMPPRHSNRKDLWGYYNGSQPGSYNLSPELWKYPDDVNHRKTFLGQYSAIPYDTYTGSVSQVSGEERLMNSNAMQAGILKKIVYPTGGYTRYEYEPHKFSTPAHNNPLQGGGLRIKKIIRSNGINETHKNASIKWYRYENANGDEVPGKLQVWPSFSFSDPFGTTNFSSVYGSNGGTMFVSSNSQGVMSASGGSVVLYPSISVKEFGGRGKTVYSYDIPVSFDTEKLDQVGGRYLYNRTVSHLFSHSNEVDNSPYAPNPNYAWRIALKQKEVYNENNVLLKKTVNEYEIAKSEIMKRIRFRFFDLGTRAGTGPAAGTWVNTGGGWPTYYQVNPPSQPRTYHGYAKYYDISGWYRLKKSTTYTYDETNTNAAIAQQVKFGYTGRHRKVSERQVLNSNGTSHIVRSKYPSDYNLPGHSNDPVVKAMIKMKTQFIDHMPIEKVTLLKNSSGEFVTGGELMKPAINSKTGEVVFSELWKVETLQPIAVAAFPLSSINVNNQLNTHSSYKRQSLIEAYDKHNNVIQARSEYGLPNSMIWQKESPYALIGTATNATASDIGLVSFEQPTLHDQWSFSTINGNTLQNGGHTGTKHYKLQTQYGAGGVFEVSGQRRKYKCSAWIKTSAGVKLVLTSRKRGVTGIYPSNGPVYKQVHVPNTNGEWKYAEVVIDLEAIQTANTNPGLLDVHFYFWNQAQQPVLIDDIRFGPADAPMNSYVYNNKQQLVASFDINSQKSTFEYSAEGKLAYTRNMDGDIVVALKRNISSNPSIPSSVKRIVVKSQGVKVDQDLGYLGVNPLQEWATSISYLDGMLRPVQTIQVDASPTKEDIIQPFDYVNFGLREKDYFPYANNVGIAGAYRSNALVDQKNFYSYAYQDIHGYTTKIYDQSPLDKVKSVRPAGNAFAMHPAQNLSRITIKTNAANEVRMLDGVNSSGFYPANALLVKETQDFKTNKSWEYIDKVGRLVMKKEDMGNGASAKTYYGYDKMGRLVVIYPPEQTKQMDAANWSVAKYFQLAFPKNQLYIYQYDKRGRLITKLTPEGSERYVYDNLDRLVLRNDAELKKNKKWKFIKYDVLNRPVMNGIYTHSSTVVPVIGSSSLFEKRKATGGVHGYSNETFPTNNIDVQLVNYYDSYDMTGDGVADAAFIPVNQGNFSTGWAGLSNGRGATSGQLLGKLTANKVAVLGQNNTFLTKKLFYNRYGQVIQLQSDNHIGGKDQIDLITDFEGKVRESRHVHTSNFGNNNSQTHTILETFDYDHRGRLLQQTHQIDQGDKIVLKAQEYGALGRLKKQLLHKKTGVANYLEKVAYVYDILGRVININTNSGSKFFNEVVTYDVNSNVASTRFDMPVRNPNGKVDMCPSCPTVDKYSHQYNFTYDKVDRLINAAHNVELQFTGSTSIAQYPGRYSVGNISYNLNSDLLTLRRNGLLNYSLQMTPAGKIAVANFGVTDNLTYSYHNGRLIGVSDAANNDAGFSQRPDAVAGVNALNAATHEYLYNLNGHLTKDKNKGIDKVLYNHLNLPTSLEMTGGINKLEWTYSATGEKLRKKVIRFSGPFQKDYSGIFEYGNKNLESIRTAAGRAVPNSGSFAYEYTIKDEQGNNRITFSDLDNNGQLVKTEILQQNHYYPFGMRMNGIDNRFVSAKNLYQYGGKEEQEEFGLKLFDFGPRYYDPAIGRWHAPDIKLEKYHHQSSYAYVSNNPVTLSDPTGMDEYDDWDWDWDDSQVGGGNDGHASGGSNGGGNDWNPLFNSYGGDYLDDYDHFDFDYGSDEPGDVHYGLEDAYDDIHGDGSDFYADVEPEDPPNDGIQGAIDHFMRGGSFYRASLFPLGTMKESVNRIGDLAMKPGLSPFHMNTLGIVHGGAKTLFMLGRGVAIFSFYYSAYNAYHADNNRDRAFYAMDVIMIRAAYTPTFGWYGPAASLGYFWVVRPIAYTMTKPYIWTPEKERDIQLHIITPKVDGNSIYQIQMR